MHFLELFWSSTSMFLKKTGARNRRVKYKKKNLDLTRHPATVTSLAKKQLLHRLEVRVDGIFLPNYSFVEQKQALHAVPC